MAAVTLSPDAEKMRARALRPSTLKTYEAAWKRYVFWIQTHRATGGDLWSATNVANYIAARRALDGASVATLRQDLTAIRREFRAAGHELVESHPVAESLKGARRAAVDENPPGMAVALRRDEWAAACRALRHRGTPRDLRDRAVLVIGYLGAMRRANLHALNLGDVKVEKRGLIVRLRKTKTQDGGERRVLPRGRAAETCPVVAWEEWLDVRPAVRAAAAFLATQHGRGSETLVGDRIGNSHAVERIIWRALELAAVEDPRQYSAHSLRAGLATELAELGVPLVAIQRAGGWTSLDTVGRYAARGREWEDSPLRALTY